MANLQEASRLGRRAPEPKRNPLVLQKLPFSCATFKILSEKFDIHHSFARVLKRGATMFSRTHITCGSSRPALIVYHVHMGNSEPGDLALSATSEPITGLTRAIVLGCDGADIEDFSSRLFNAGAAIRHPMLLAGIFAEVQRIRHVAKVRINVAQLLEHLYDLGRDDLDPEEEDDVQQEEPNDLIDHWLDVNHLSSGLETWRVQLKKMVDHIDELKLTVFEYQLDQKSEGDRIKERLLDIILEYEELQRKCNMVIQGTNLANGLSWNHIARRDNKTNRSIAQASNAISAASKLDSSQMKSIALLTMIFLPATFVSSFFAMPLFNWDPDLSKGQSVMSGYLWIYGAATAGLTVAVVCLWAFWSNYTRKRGKAIGIVSQRDIV